ncbi:hypothetical protein [Kibdelosporangium persicum]|nr:hypothetical protein [Kibdelosporangium persicum]
MSVWTLAEVLERAGTTDRVTIARLVEPWRDAREMPVIPFAEPQGSQA